MADRLDLSNPTGVVVMFLATMVTMLASIIKLGMAGGIIGVVAGLGIFFKMMWFDK